MLLQLFLKAARCQQRHITSGSATAPWRRLSRISKSVQRRNGLDSGGLGDDRLDAGAAANSLFEEADLDLTFSSDPATQTPQLTRLGNDSFVGRFNAALLIGGNRTESTSGIDFLTGNGGVDVLRNDVADTPVDAGADSLVANVFATLPNWIDAL